MTTPFFSVIMNTYNGAPWIRQAIDSVLAQSFTDWELIIWDDGSTDQTPAIAASYTDPRIRVVPTTDRAGLAKAREKAVRVTKGRWLAFLDQDDLWEPSKLQAQHDRIHAAQSEPGPPLGICYTRALRFNSQGPLGDFDHHHLPKDSPEGDVFQRLFTHSCFICMSAVALEREAVLAALPMPDFVKFCPDYFLYIAISRTRRACAVPEQLCKYRIHDKNMSVVHRMRINHEIIAIVEPWKSALPPRVFKRRVQIHKTLIALDELREKATRQQGLTRLFREGSIRYLLERPFAKIRRKLLGLTN